MNVYDIFLDRRDTFIFYQVEDVWTPVTHTTNYQPCRVGIWDAETQTMGKSEQPHIDRIVVPTWRVKPQDLQDFIEHHSCLVVDNIIGLGGDELKRYNIMIPQREVEGNYIEVGLFGRSGIGEKINERADRAVNKKLKLKAFW